MESINTLNHEMFASFACIYLFKIHFLCFSFLNTVGSPKSKNVALFYPVICYYFL